MQRYIVARKNTKRVKRRKRKVQTFLGESSAVYANLFKREIEREKAPPQKLNV